MKDKNEINSWNKSTIKINKQKDNEDMENEQYF